MSKSKKQPTEDGPAETLAVVAGSASVCPICGDPTIQPRDSSAYCENCGWPEENREVDPEAVIDDITSEVLNVVSPEGHDTEEWQQVRDAVAKAIKPLMPNTKFRDGEDGRSPSP